MSRAFQPSAGGCNSEDDPEAFFNSLLASTPGAMLTDPYAGAIAAGGAYNSTVLPPLPPPLQQQQQQQQAFAHHPFERRPSYELTLEAQQLAARLGLEPGPAGGGGSSSGIGGNAASSTPLVSTAPGGW